MWPKSNFLKFWIFILIGIKAPLTPKKLYREFNKTLLLVSKNPEMGIETELDSVRGIIVRDFILFYELRAEEIIVHTVWDTRQNPDDLKIK
ncbi:type II toxin-antitoxin system RelE/ParE family toxin [Algoriphagus boritolerans]|uniref:type II toxin-antitoxin system RelE/ParE family toxin n=1 Tax=Algoriphagus boritolerans TaxID=308111 RepID=UPI002FCE33AE